MSKAVLQSVGEDTVAFNDTCYWVADNVKRFLTNFQPGMEVDVTVKDIEGTPMVTFLKKAGFPTTPQGARPPQTSNQAYPPQQQQSYQAPPKQAPAPSTGNQADAMYTLAAAIVVAYNLDTGLVQSVAKVLAGKV